MNNNQILNSQVLEEEKQIYSILKTKEGELLMDWLEKKTIKKQLGQGVADGMQTALMTHRELGRRDVYFEFCSLINKIESYVNRNK